MAAVEPVSTVTGPALGVSDGELLVQLIDYARQYRAANVQLRRQVERAEARVAGAQAVARERDAVLAVERKLRLAAEGRVLRGEAETARAVRDAVAAERERMVADARRHHKRRAAELAECRQRTRDAAEWAEAAEARAVEAETELHTLRRHQM